jgi:hypothetical protein
MVVSGFILMRFDASLRLAFSGVAVSVLEIPRNDRRWADKRQTRKMMDFDV